MGNVNRFAFVCMQHDLSRAVRLNNLFDNDSYLIAMANDSATSPGGKSCVFSCQTIHRCSLLTGPLLCSICGFHGDGGEYRL